MSETCRYSIAVGGEFDCGNALSPQNQRGWCRLHKNCDICPRCGKLMSRGTKGIPKMCKACNHKRVVISRTPTNKALIEPRQTMTATLTASGHIRRITHRVDWETIIKQGRESEDYRRKVLEKGSNKNQEEE